MLLLPMRMLCLADQLLLCVSVLPVSQTATQTAKFVLQVHTRLLLFHSCPCQLHQGCSLIPDLMPLSCMLQGATTTAQTNTDHTLLSSTSTAAAASCAPLSSRAAAQPNNCAQSRHRRVPPSPHTPARVLSTKLCAPTTPPQHPMHTVARGCCYPPAHLPAASINSKQPPSSVVLLRPHSLAVPLGLQTQQSTTALSLRHWHSPAHLTHVQA